MFIRRAAVVSLGRFGAILIPFAMISACAGGAALQPDRSIFSLDSNYQRFTYFMPIEETFDRTVDRPPLSGPV
jgi:hypothetical protein